MQNSQEDLLLSTLESRSEDYFNQKCKELLYLCGKDKLCEHTKTPHIFQYFFTSAVLSSEGINHALLKKYYLSSHKETEVTRALDELLKEGNIKAANDMLNFHSTARSEILGIYIDNINMPNTQLLVENCNKEDYETLNNTLKGIDRFYQGKHQRTSTPVVLKKSYK